MQDLVNSSTAHLSIATPRPSLFFALPTAVSSKSADLRKRDSYGMAMPTMSPRPAALEPHSCRGCVPQHHFRPELCPAQPQPCPLSVRPCKQFWQLLGFSNAVQRAVSCCSTAIAEVPASGVSEKAPSLPFVKIAGQEDMKLSLLLNVVDQSIGGVLIMGDRGTGKSVAVRALVDLLPKMDVVEGDPFQSHPTVPALMGSEAYERYQSGQALPTLQVPTPLVELPLGATEDRICGTIDIEKALQEGLKAFEPGLLAKANRGILYVDEVNLLDDGLVDVVLDSAASGINTVEREGVSVRHPAKFIMIGSGNPQEGELRPQLLDRFGLSVSVATMQDRDLRTQMVLDHLAFEADPDGLCASAEAEQATLRARLVEAAARVQSGDVGMPRDLRLKISEICSLLDIDGIRGDITVNRAAIALAAFEGAREVTLQHIQRVLGLSLNHRLRKDPLSTIDNGTKVALAFQRITNPERAKKEEQKRKEALAAAEKKAKAAQEAAAPKKPGAWGGLPGR